MALFCVFSCGREGPPARTELELERLLPIDSLGEWVVAEGPLLFSPDNLWEYLNGGAPRYEAYGFKRLVHVRYQLGMIRWRASPPTFTTWVPNSGRSVSIEAFGLPTR